MPRKKKVVHHKIRQVRTEEVRGHPHVVEVELDDKSRRAAAVVIVQIEAGVETFSMTLPDGAPGFKKDGDNERPVGVQQCQDCLDEVLFA